MSCEVGTQLGPYRLTAECGSGAYGRVFVAENTLTGQPVTVISFSLIEHIPAITAIS
mgnify:CR=1 FL=1